MASRFSQFLVSCIVCGGKTSKTYARAHNGSCKQCTTGEVPRGLKCPTCGEYTLTAYQKAHHYHCDSCTRNADPEGYRNEVMGYND
jgi:hypothetical protein